MTSETDQPRQRTVAELLAEHGDAGATGRRRRRREADGPGEGGDPSAPDRGPVTGSALSAGRRLPPPQLPSRPIVRDPGLPAARQSLDPQPAGRHPGPAGPARPPVVGPRGNSAAGGGARPAGPPNGEPVWPRAESVRPTAEADRPRSAPVRATPNPTRHSADPVRPAPEPVRRAAMPPRRPVEPVRRSADPVRPPADEAWPKLESAWPKAEPVRPVAGPVRPKSEPVRPAVEPVRAAEPVRERPTDQMPRIRDDRPAPDRRPTPPAQQAGDGSPRPLPGRHGAAVAAHAGALAPGTRGPGAPRRAPAAAPPDGGGFDGGGFDASAPSRARTDAARLGDPLADGGPPTAVGEAPVGAESWHRERTAGRSASYDGGPPTQAAAVLDFDDHPAGLGAPPQADPQHLGPGRGGSDVGGPDRGDRPGPGHGLDSDPGADGGVDDVDPDSADHPDYPDYLDAADHYPDDRADRPGAMSHGQAWAAVIAQWIGGAVGGAALWVAFRFLWRSFPVVALAASVLVTVGLVLLVRALLHNEGRRTTVFAVLVGLLLTASPALLVLLGR
jgi:hypothetical protein